jgi:hypothetical protein
MIHMVLQAVTPVQEPASDLEIWLRFAGTLSGIVITGLLGYLATRTKIDSLATKVDVASGRADNAAINAETAAEKAGEAAKLAEPTGNGFAAKVLSQLDNLRDGQAEIHAAQVETARVLNGHIADHASSDLRRSG